MVLESIGLTQHKIIVLTENKYSGGSVMYKFIGLIFFSFAFMFTANAQLRSPETLEAYESSLVGQGISWKAGQSTFLPSFYTGFAPKIETANRIHFQLGRGNQARLTGVLDEFTVLTYLYNLKARAEFMSAVSRTVITPEGQDQSGAYQSVVASSTYRIGEIISDFESGRITRESFYKESLEVLKALNPGRVFSLKFEMTKVLSDWKSKSLLPLARKSGASNSQEIRNYLSRNSDEAIVVANDLLFGRINTVVLTSDQLGLIAEFAAETLRPSLSEDIALRKFTSLFHSLTENRYQFKVVDGGRTRNALECESSTKCDLVYSEFTAIYPVGSVKAYSRDRNGNNIPMIREVGGLNFIDRPHREHDVDHIRSEAFYGWMTKMDYTPEGNGIHNPAVRLHLPNYRELYRTLNIPTDHNTMWLVARGGVSSGCTRMAGGHIHEVRHIFPSSKVEMKNLEYYGNHSADYDLFDIDGSGELKVMGVNYFVAYALAGNSGAQKREGSALVGEAFQRLPFYNLLYGRKDQFRVVNDRLIFSNPYRTYFSGTMEGRKRAKAFSVPLRGEFELYEAPYEKDKLQFFSFKRHSVSGLTSGRNGSNRLQQLVRVFGRVQACGVFKSEFKECNEDEFKKESAEIITRL